MSIDSNEFLTSPDDNRIRPFTTGIHPHKGTVATILLYTSGDITAEDKDQYFENDYLTNLTMEVENLESETVGAFNETPPEIPGGRIATISLDDKSPDNYYGVFNNFSLLGVREAHSEIVKLHQNFSNGWNAFFFGEKPVIYQFSGSFIDSMDYPYYQEFMVAYNKYLSGRKCIENQMQLKMIYDGKIIDGYMLNITVNYTAELPESKPFSFTILVKNIKWVRINLVPIETRNGIILEERWNAMSNIKRLAGVEFDESKISADDKDSYGDLGKQLTG